MGRHSMRVAVLTSSRAEYGIYVPLLNLLKNDPFFELEIIAFGTHVSEAHGFTLNEIVKDGFEVAHQIETAPDSDSPESISFSIGKTIELFSSFWKDHTYDFIFALGDRYEMFAAVSSVFPFNMKVAHISGGETTLGAIDNAFRHSITLMSHLHFTSSEVYKSRVIELIGTADHVYNVGALNIDNIKKLKLLSIDAFKERFNIDLSIQTILITFHPETIAFEKNVTYVEELIDTLKACNDYQLVITMPNADTMGNIVRARLQQFIQKTSNAIEVESFGSLGYLSCMKHCTLMLGNTSSGFVEASGLSTYVINIGDRQKGRIITQNMLDVPIQKAAMLSAIQTIRNAPALGEISVYGDGHAAENICTILKQYQ